MGEGARALAQSLSGESRNEAAYLPLFWMPVGKATRTLPQFPEYARKVGLAALWDANGEPDLCKRRAPGEYVCE
jgi:hypothetical protein